MSVKPGTAVLLAVARIRKDCKIVEAYIRRRRELIAKKAVKSRRRNAR